MLFYIVRQLAAKVGIERTNMPENTEKSGVEVWGG